MSRSADKSLLRAKPEMAHAVAAAKGEGTAAMAVKDACDEEFAGKQMYSSMFEVGESVFLETAIWVYLGRVVHVGFDFIVLEQASRVAVDGRHSVLMRTGTADGVEIEMTGTPPNNQVRIAMDWIGMSCRWIHPLPTMSIG